jgi:hypothetical protein
MTSAQLTKAQVLEAFDRWNDGNPGPAYGRVVLFGADRISLEELVRAVLSDQGLGPDRWGEYSCLVCRAFEEWMRVVYPGWTLPAAACPECLERAA